MSAALSYALSGHLVLATLHANNSYHALGRILSFYPPETRPALLSDLASGCGDRLAAAGARQARRPRAGGRGAAEHQAGGELIERATCRASRRRWRSLAEGSQTFEQTCIR
jgi:twitching motility protein PilU